MKVLHIIVGLEIGGAELMLKRLVEAQTDLPDHSHEVVSLTGLGAIGRQLARHGVSVHALHMGGALGFPNAFFRLVRLIQRIRPDVVQTWMYHADLLGGIAARWAGVKHIVWGVRTTNVAEGGSHATALVRRLCAWLSSRVPHTIVCAAEASRKAHVALGYDAARMQVVPNGFDLARLRATGEQRNTLRLQCSLEHNAVVIGYLGRFHPVKDQQNFVRAAGILAGQRANTRFLMVGTQLDASNVQLTAWIRATGHADRFVLLGERTDVPACLSAMDEFSLSSRTEGFPNVVAEAMAMGLPCVVTDVGDAAMLVADTGVVVPKEDATALAAGLENMLAMAPDARLQLGRRARERVTTEFSMERACARFDRIYQQALLPGCV